MTIPLALYLLAAAYTAAGLLALTTRHLHLAFRLSFSALCALGGTLSILLARSL